MEQYGTAFIIVDKPEAGFRDIELEYSYAEAEDTANYMNARLPDTQRAVVVKISKV